MVNKNSEYTLLTRTEAAKKLSVTYAAITKMIDDGRIRPEDILLIGETEHKRTIRIRSDAPIFTRGVVKK